MKSCSVVVATLLAACGGSDNSSKADAGTRADAPPSCPMPGTPLPAGMHTLYLSFTGVTLTLDDCDDAPTNCSSLVSQASTVVPAFTLPARVSTIASMVQESLAPFSVDVVTTRPASGDYRMVSVGGTSETITGGTGLLLEVKSVCDATNRNSIALVFEQDAEEEFSDRAYADLIAGAFGRMAGLVSVARSGDCMCTLSTCTHTQTCTWSTAAVAPPGNDCDRTNQNEHLLLMDAVGCR